METKCPAGKTKKDCRDCDYSKESLCDYPHSIKKKRVILLNDVRGDFPIGHNTIASAGVYEAHINPHGAVSVVADNGNMLGVKPSEFEWLDVI